MNYNDPRNHFLALPDDLLLRICSHLSHQDLSSLCHGYQRLNNLALDVTLQKDVAMEIRGVACIVNNVFDVKLMVFYI